MKVCEIALQEKLVENTNGKRLDFCVYRRDSVRRVFHSSNVFNFKKISLKNVHAAGASRFLLKPVHCVQFKNYSITVQ